MADKLAQAFFDRWYAEFNDHTTRAQDLFALAQRDPTFKDVLARLCRKGTCELNPCHVGWVLRRAHSLLDQETFELEYVGRITNAKSYILRKRT